MNNPKVDIGMEDEIVDFCARGCGEDEESAPGYSCNECAATDEECVRFQKDALARS